MKGFRKFSYFVLVLTMSIALMSGCNPKNNNLTDDTTNNPTESTASNDLTEATTSNDPVETATDSSSTDVSATEPATSVGIDENGLWKGIKASDYVKNLNYKAMPIPSSVHQISQETLQSEIDYMLTSYSTMEQITDRAVANGDKVNIDYSGSVDGIKFENGSATGASVTAGSTEFIDDFLTQIIGHMPGETFDVKVTFPAEYQEASLQGKDAVFSTTINYIENSIKPDLTDEFVKTNFSTPYGWETVDKMKEGMAEEMKKQAIINYIGENMDIWSTVSSVPDELISRQQESMLQYYQGMATSYGMGFEEFIGTGLGFSSVDELIESNRETNLQNANYYLALQAVAEDAGISVSDEDMLKYIPDYTQYVEQYGLPYLKQSVLIQKVLDYIIDNAVLES